MPPPSARSGSGSADADRSPGAGEAPRLVLASASPRRRQLLELLGIDFDVVVPDVAEVRSGDPDVVVIENARRKAHAGRAAVGGRGSTLGVDTDVAIDGRLIGKPEDERGARERLELLSGRTHEVLSGVVLLDTAIGSEIPVERSGIARTEVGFADLDPATIELYLRSGDWEDRAGAYAIQGLGSILISEMRGDFSNVVGLPVALLLELMPRMLT